MAVQGKSITVLGAGVGGLTAAIALAQRGARVSVLEQAPEISEVGAGIQISPNGSTVLAALGLGKALREVSIQLEGVELLDYRHGREVARVDLTRARHSNSHPYLVVHRADLIEVLANAARANDVQILFDKEVTGVAIGFEQATLPIDGGPQRTTKILVAADGLRSLTRQALNIKKKPDFTGHVAWRTTIESAYLPLYDIPPVARVFMGPGRHLVTYPLRDGKLVNVVAVERRDAWVEEGWNYADNPDNLRAAFAGFAPEVQRLLSVAQDCKLWGLFKHPVAENWSQSSTVILGDACHPTLPYLAQGANMALEDAFVLAQEMDAHEELHSAFEAYKKRRFKRVRRIVNAASSNAKIYHQSNPVLRRVMQAGMSGLSRISPDRMTARYNWLYGHDVAKGD